MTRFETYLTNLARFARDEGGAVTVDWMVLTAAVVGLAIAMAVVLGGAADDHSDRVGTALSSRGIVTF